jgi:hypothetical protein
MAIHLLFTKIDCGDTAPDPFEKQVRGAGQSSLGGTRRTRSGNKTKCQGILGSGLGCKNMGVRDSTSLPGPLLVAWDQVLAGRHNTGCVSPYTPFSAVEPVLHVNKLRNGGQLGGNLNRI